MMKTIVVIAALLASHGVHAQDVSAEVGSATVWFALLVVLFAVLVSVGIFLARDHGQDEKLDAGAKPQPTPAKTRGPRPLRPRHAHARRKQQEFS